jgi:hypothetical protein
MLAAKCRSLSSHQNTVQIVHRPLSGTGSFYVVIEETAKNGSEKIMFWLKRREDHVQVQAEPHRGLADYCTDTGVDSSARQRVLSVPSARNTKPYSTTSRQPHKSEKACYHSHKLHLTFIPLWRSMYIWRLKTQEMQILGHIKIIITQTKYLQAEVLLKPTTLNSTKLQTWTTFDKFKTYLLHESSTNSSIT